MEMELQMMSVFINNLYNIGLTNYFSVTRCCWMISSKTVLNSVFLENRQLFQEKFMHISLLFFIFS